jgi:hypothetical protein
MTSKDEIVEEVRAAREAYAARFDFDLRRIFEDLRRKEDQSTVARAHLKPLKPHRQAK